MDYPLATTTWDHQEQEALERVIASGRFTMGPEVERFEDLFASYHGSRHAVMVNSGSSANLLMVASLFFRKDGALKPGDEVIVPAVSWSTSYTPLQQYGLKVVFVDVQLDTLNVASDSVISALSPRTKAVLAVNLLGNPTPLDHLCEIAEERGLILLEDNCESLGARLDGRLTGTFGLMGTFSFFFSHHMSTMEGGMVLTDDEELSQILRSLRAHGWTRQLPRNNLISLKSPDPFYESFRFVLPGYNLRPLELSGALGQTQLAKLPMFVQRRRANAVLFSKLFSDDTRFIIQRENGESSWFGFSLIIEDSRLERDTVIQKLRDSGVETRPIVAGNFLENPVVTYFDYRVSGSLVNAQIIHTNGFFVGNNHQDLSAELEHLCVSLAELR